MLGGPSSAGARFPRPYGERWVYGSFNLQVEKSVDDLIALIGRASRAGYTGILLADYKFQVLYRVPGLLLPQCRKGEGRRGPGQRSS